MMNDREFVLEIAIDHLIDGNFWGHINVYEDAKRVFTLDASDESESITDALVRIQFTVLMERPKLLEIVQESIKEDWSDC
jgi:urate oxidase